MTNCFKSIFCFTSFILSSSETQAFSTAQAWFLLRCNLR